VKAAQGAALAALLGALLPAAAAQGMDGQPSVAERELQSRDGRPLEDLKPEEVLDAARVGAAGEATPLPDPAAITAALQRGVDWLVAHQNHDGSWGGWQNPGPYDEFWSNINTHKAWIVATTGLAVMSLLEHKDNPAATAAFDKGLQFLVQEPVPKRPSDWDTDNTWGSVYGLDALATVLHDGRIAGKPLEGLVRAKCEAFVEDLGNYQTPSGGWGYYDFESLAKRPSWATSFQTGAALVALVGARDAGIAVPGKVVSRAMDALRRCRLANGAYAYSIDPIPTMGLEWIDNVKGSLSRIQCCNFALLRAGANDVSRQDVLTGLDEFFEDHRFLDVARKKPIPHETYYYNSGYFYFFGHFYAARLLETLQPADRARYAARLAREVVKTLEPDGSMWDYAMNSYGPCYGTAFGTMTLSRTLPER